MGKIEELNKALTDVEKEMYNIENVIINEPWVTVDMLKNISLNNRLIELHETASSVKEHIHTVLLEYKELVTQSLDKCNL